MQGKLENASSWVGCPGRPFASSNACQLLGLGAIEGPFMDLRICQHECTSKNLPTLVVCVLELLNITGGGLLSFVYHPYVCLNSPLQSM